MSLFSFSSEMNAKSSVDYMSVRVVLSYWFRHSRKSLAIWLSFRRCKRVPEKEKMELCRVLGVSCPQWRPKGAEHA